ncbi:hypothetical protein E2C01_067252 [Portunus trituberculatus]|uniref:Uncharacterized protein n=1 Tax=Portunus trituberculatus TaxID=210409 RepID=A0A5B7HW62_PORTR|nr:hypothetical protein [Portunus trituberculatus]
MDMSIAAKHHDPFSVTSFMFTNSHYPANPKSAGGPGSGKMTHAQNLADIHEGYRHINLTVVISEYIKENGFAHTRYQEITAPYRPTAVGEQAKGCGRRGRHSLLPEVTRQLMRTESAPGTRITK